MGNTQHKPKMLLLICCRNSSSWNGWQGQSTIA